jgi:hypothetical protein
MKKFIARSCVSLAALAAASGLLGQTTGSLSGWVRNAEGRPLAAVRLTARSPSLQGERTAVTGADGRFLMRDLPPGDYEVRAALEGFTTAVQSGVLLRIDREITLEFQLAPSFSEEVTVLGAPPILDVTGTAIGVIVERGEFERLPIGRSYSSLAYLAPGVVDGGYDPGSPSIAGASAAENRYIVDGLDTTSPGFGILAGTLPPEFLEVVEIKTGGFGLEYGGALGGVINVLTRSGGNDFHASAFGYYRNDGFGADPPKSVQNDQFLGSRTYDYGATLGGGILRDGLWYFLGVNPTSDASDWITSQGLRVTDESRVLTYAGKLSWQLHPGHRVVASAFGNPGESTGTFRFAAGLLRDTFDTQIHHFVLAYDAILGRDLTLELSAGRQKGNTTRSPAADRPWYTDSTGGGFARAQNCGDPDLVVNGMSFAPGCLGGTFVYDHLDGLRDELRLSTTGYARTGRLNHQLKVGATLRRVKMEFNTLYPAPVPGPFYDSAGTLVDAGGLAGQQWTLFPDFARLDEREQDTPGQNDELALYFQDQVSIGGRWTLQLGIRADAFDSTGRKTEQDGSARLKFGLEEMIAPRLGLALDPIGMGRSKLFAHYARYYESMPLYFTKLFGNTRRNFYFFAYPESGALPSAEDPGVLLSRTSRVGVVRVASNLHPQHTDEYLLGFEHQLGQDVSVGVTGVYRKVGDVLEEFSIDDRASFIFGNPGGTITSHPVTGVPLPAPVVFAEPTREYRALQASFQKRLRNNWQLAGSYVYSKNEGNYVGLYKQDLGQLAPNLTADFDLPELADNASGLLPNDRTHQVKLYGSYQWSFGLITGLFAQYLSGTPISKIGYHQFYGPFRYIAPRGSAGRTPDLITLDLHTEYPIPLAKRHLTVALFADLFNVTDAQHPIVVDQIWTFAAARTTEDPNECGGPGTGPGTSCPDGNPNWGQPILFQTPRALRIGARLSW